MAETAHSGAAIAAPSAPRSFADFDLIELDHVACDLDIIKSLVDVAVVPVSGASVNGQNLVCAALHRINDVIKRHSAVHDALLALKREVK